MKSNIIFLPGFFLLLCIITMACTHQAPTVAATMGSIATRGSVKEIILTPSTQDFPEHEGKKEFLSYCAICHSLKYISMQPDFSRKTWDAEVHKMVEKFGAPIDSVTSRKIVDYLVAVKGSK